VSDDARSARRDNELTAQPTAAVATARADLEVAMKREYDQECARSAAEATGVGPWGAAARDRLHAAISAVYTARANLIAAQAAEHCIPHAVAS